MQDAGLRRAAAQFSIWAVFLCDATQMLTMTVLPLYWMIWQDRPTSLPPPRQRNLSSSAGSTGSSLAAFAIAEALRLDAIVMSFA